MRLTVDQSSLDQLMQNLGAFDQKVRRRIEKAAMVNFGKAAKLRVSAAVTQGNESLAKNIDYKVGRTKARRAKNDQGKWKTIRPSATYCVVGAVSGVPIKSSSHVSRPQGYTYPRWSSKSRNWGIYEAHLARWYEAGFRTWRKGVKSNRKGKGWRKGLNGQGLGPVIYKQKWFEQLVPGLELQCIAFLEQEVQSAIADSSRYQPKSRKRRVR
jgi:hypothetical protein